MKISTILVLYVCISTNVKCNNDAVIDLSDECENNLKVNFFLTYGMGFADGLALTFTNYYKNCTLNLYTSKTENSTVQIVILEAITGMQWDNFCQDNRVIISDEFEEMKLCPELKQTSNNILYIGLFKYHKTTVKLRTNSSVGLKLTATSARLLSENEECDQTKEISCTIVNRPVCVNIDLQCDQNINCGKYEMFDEDTSKCHSELYNRHIAIIIPGLILFMIVCLIILKICYNAAPKLPKHFFTSVNSEDNKLIVMTRTEHCPKKASSPKKSSAPSLEKTKYQQCTNVSAFKVASGDLAGDPENELKSHYYTAGKNYKAHKRLTTNSPVYRNTRVATILLESIKSLEDFGSDISDNDSMSPPSPNLVNSRPVEKAIHYSKRRRCSIPDLI